VRAETLYTQLMTTSLLGRTDGKRNAFDEDLKDAFLTITARLLNKAAPPTSRCHAASAGAGNDP